MRFVNQFTTKLPATILLLILFLVPVAAFSDQTVSICSFNIQFLGNSKERHNANLAEVVKDFDIVVIQELVAPPYDGQYPNGNTYQGDIEAAKFFDEMKSQGFAYALSEEDTGTSPKIHKKSSATEWWVAFYKPEVLEVANDLPHGFLDSDRSDNPNYERVPYAFGFRTLEGTLDFVLVSVHLQPGASNRSRIRRLHELDTIARWIDDKDTSEKDFIILGDMNIEDCEELNEATPADFVSLNNTCQTTNTNVNGPKPYDHVMYRPLHTQFDMNSSFQFSVVNLVDALRDRWDESTLGPYPGSPYNHNSFRKYYSDHNPVVFQMLTGADGD